MKISCVIPTRSLEDPLLKDLIESIKAQDYPQEDIEIIPVTEGDSEQAKAIGIRKATGYILCMLCADNLLVDKEIFQTVKELFTHFTGLAGVYSKFYHYRRDDNSLNRYFALIGANDVIPFYLGKADRKPWYEQEDSEFMTFLNFEEKIPSLGDNGFFIKASWFKDTELDHYYPMDNCEDMRRKGRTNYLRLNNDYVWHRTAENLWTFMKKRYRYARDLYSKRSDRRWMMVRDSQDWFKLVWFSFQSCLIIPTLAVSIRGFIAKPDWAWFWHPAVSLAATFTYGVLWLRHHLFRSLFQRSAGLKVSESV